LPPTFFIVYYTPISPGYLFSTIIVMSSVQCSTVADVMSVLAAEEIGFVNVKFVDPFGVWQNLTMPKAEINKDVFADGIPFDGSSVRGWQSINESDMLLMLDPVTVFIDPFMESTVSITATVAYPDTKAPYARDPRTIAKMAVEAMQKSGIADTVYFGPEAEFFIFDSVKYSVGSGHSYYEVDSEEAIWNTAQDENAADGNTGYKIPHKRGYFPVAPMDKTGQIRMDMMQTLGAVGITVEKGHHEVATAGQGEINFRFADLLTTADNMMKYKYVLRNVAADYGKYLTFLPKPLAGDNGSGMHCHFSLFKDGQNLMSGDGYAGLSDVALSAIAGIVKHGRALAAFTNPTVNSYRRLIPGFEAPVCLGHSFRNRSVAIRVPYVPSAKARRIECRFPDASSNPYLAFSAILCAAMDGIKNNLKAADALDFDLYEAPSEKTDAIPKMPASLEEAVEALKADRAFLEETGVFDSAFIDMWIEAKEAEVDEIRRSINPKEFELYGDV